MVAVTVVYDVKIKAMYTAQKYTAWLYLTACGTKKSYLINEASMPRNQRLASLPDLRT
jgi:hypothetical protein